MSYGSTGPHPSEARPAGDSPDEPLALTGERYRVIGLLGQGGMGRVFSVFDSVLGREVALKEVLDPDPSSERRLLTEARLSAELEHPGIVPVYDAGRTATGRLYYTMRLIRGRPLRALLDGTASHLELSRHVLDAARAVAFAHERGLLHRDLKPENVLVGSLGETQVADWGLAVRASQAAAETSFQGTRAYAAPELLEGKPPSKASDVYALGAILREVAGPAARLEPALRSIIAKATAPDLELRYVDAAAFARSLLDYLDGRLVAEHRYAPVELLRHFWRRWRAPLLAGAGALLVGIAGVVARTVELVAERDRASTAEVSATAKTAELLLQRAHALTTEGAIEEALETLEEMPASSARVQQRGLAMALHAFGLPRLLESRALPRCERRWRVTGGTVCSSAGLLAFEPDAEGQSGTVVAVDAVVAAAKGAELVVQTRVGRLRGLRLPELAGELDVEGANYAIEVGGTPSLLWSRNPGVLVVVDRREGRRASLEPCTGLEIAAVVEDGEGLQVWCGDGSRRAVDRLGQLGSRTPPVLEPPLQGLASWTDAGAGRVVVVTARGLVIELPSGRRLAELRAKGAVRQVVTVASHVGPLLALRTDRGLVTLVEPTSGQEVAMLPRRSDGELSAMGGELVWLGRETMLRFDADPVSSGVLQTNEGVIDVAVNAERVAVGGGNGLWLDWQPSKRKVTRLDPGTTGAVKGVGLTPRRVIAAGVALRGASWIDTSTGETGRALAARDMTMRAAGGLRGGRAWLLGYGGGPWLVDEAGAMVGPDDGGTLERPGVPVWLQGSTFGDGTGFVMVREDGLVRRVDEDGQLVDEVRWPRAAHAVAASRSAPMIISDGTQVTLRPGVRVTPGSEVTALAVDARSRWVAVGTVDGTLRVYDAESGSLVAEARLHQERISALAFSATDLVSASWDRSVRKWALAPLERP